MEDCKWWDSDFDETREDSITDNSDGYVASGSKINDSEDLNLSTKTGKSHNQYELRPRRTLGPADRLA